MRRAMTLATLFGAALLLQGCVGFDTFIDNTLTTRDHPNRPMGDSMNMRRVQGMQAAAEPIVPEPGNVWPSGVVALPTLQDMEGGTAPPRRGSELTIPGRQSAADPAPAAAAPAPIPLAAVPSGNGTSLPDLARAPAAARRYQTVSTPAGTDVLAPNGDGTTTALRANGAVETVPAQR